MPSRWLIHVRVRNGEAVRPHHLHAVVCEWLDDDHDAPRKPFSIAGLQHVAEDVWRFEVGLLDDRLESRLACRAKTAIATAFRLKSMPARVLAVGGDPFLRLARQSWREIAESAASGSRISLTFRTPTVFRGRGRIRYEDPIAPSVFGHYRALWRAFAPELEPRLDFKEAGLKRTGVKGVVKAHGIRDGETCAGFTGVAVYQIESTGAAERRAFNALAGVATYAGTGANTTFGMGVTVISGGPDDG